MGRVEEGREGEGEEEGGRGEEEKGVRRRVEEGERDKRGRGRGGGFSLAEWVSSSTPRVGISRCLGLTSLFSKQNQRKRAGKYLLGSESKACASLCAPAPPPHPEISAIFIFRAISSWCFTIRDAFLSSLCPSCWFLRKCHSSVNVLFSPLHPP